MKTHVQALTKAVEIAGSQGKLAAALADYLGRPTVKQQTVSYWLANETLLGPEWWPAIEHVTNDAVTREDLRPDVFRASAA
jgi:DNA-binding transcriptional regulator YdaS (Cro superfamily)